MTSPEFRVLSPEPGLDTQDSYGRKAVLPSPCRTGERRSPERSEGELIVPPTFGPRCCLCWERFRVGDVYKSVWPKGGPPVSFALSMHPACFGQLAPGDLGRIFAALGRRLALPIAVLNGRRHEVPSPESRVLSGLGTQDSGLRTGER